MESTSSDLTHLVQSQERILWPDGSPVPCYIVVYIDYVNGRVQLVAPEYAGVSNNAPRLAQRGALLDTPAYSGATN